MEIDLNNISSVCDQIFSMFDSRLFTETGSEIQDVRNLTLAQHELFTQQTHPLENLRKRIPKETERSIKSKRFQFSTESLLFIHSVISLTDIEPKSKLDRIISAIEEQNKFYSGFFEANIFSLYIKSHFDINTVPESDSYNRKTPDFAINTTYGTTFIECKSLESQKVRERKIWSQIGNLVVRKLVREKKCWNVSLLATREISGKDINETIDKLSRMIERDTLKRKVTVKNGIELYCEKISEPDIWTNGTLNLEKKEYGWLEGEFTVNPDGTPKYRNPCAFSGTPHVQTDLLKRILKHIKYANTQIPNGFPGVLYIEVPFEDGEHILDTIDPIFDKVFDALPRYKNINALVLYGRTIDRFCVNGENPIQEYDVTIPNKYPLVDLPKDFKILGSPTQQYAPSINGSEGTVFLEFSLERQLNQQLGRNLIYVRERHGKEQIRLWQSYENCFRADIITTTIGRKSFRADLNHLPINSNHKIAVRYNSQTAAAAVNGRMLEVMDPRK